MNKTAIILPFFCLLLSTSHASDWKSRFDFTVQEKSQAYKASSLSFKAHHFEEASVSDYNKAVELNNSAIDSMNAGNYEQAVADMKEAVSIAPAAINFRKNYIIALNNSHNHPQTLIDEANILLGMDPDDHKTAYLAALAYINDIKDYKKAADYLSYAIKRAPQEPQYLSALITALENSKNYSDTVFELLKKHAKTIDRAYDYYLLGIKYLDKKQYNKAISCLEKAKKLVDKNEGYAHHAYVRAAFYGGYMAGLAENAKIALQNFPQDQNIDSTKRIYKALTENKYNLTEHVTLNISGASSMKSLNFTIRPIKDYYNHQKVNLTSAELISRNKRYPAEVVENTDGSITISVPMNIVCPEIALELKYKLTMDALFGFYIQDSSNPQACDYVNDNLLSLDDNRIEQLANYIDKLELQNKDGITTSDEEFVTKAAMAVAHGLNYLENGVDKPVSWALDNMDSCDCTEYSRLLAALCIKKGIPAKLATGFLIKSDNMNKETSIGHEWCDIYIRGRGWIPVDATLQSTMDCAYLGNLLSDQIFFEHFTSKDKSRICIDYSATSSDVSIEMNNTYRLTNSN